MSSPSTTWSGSLQLGLLNIPITIGKAYKDLREDSLKNLCSCHHKPIDRTERCVISKDAPEGKVKGVEKADGTWHVLGEDAVAAIEDSTKSEILEITDVQPLTEIPMHLSLGVYYLRPDKKQRAAAVPFGILVEALRSFGANRVGLIAKWCRSTKQRLVVIHEVDGVIVLNELPMASEYRPEGDQELAYEGITLDPKAVKMCAALINQSIGKDGFRHDAYVDEGYIMRRDAVNKILEGEEPEKVEITEQKAAPDVLAALTASVEATK